MQLRMITRRWLLGAATALGAIAFAPTAMAAGGVPLTETWFGIPRWVWLMVNLAVFWGLIFKLAGPPVRRFLDQRAEQIASAAAKAKEQRLEVDEMRSSLESRIAELQRDVDEMVTRAEKSAEAEREEILARTEQEKERLIEQTRDEIDARVEQARVDLQREAAALSVQLASAKISSSLDGGDRNRLFEEALERLEKEAMA